MAKRRKVLHLKEVKGARMRGPQRSHRGIHEIGLGHLLDFLSELLVLQKNSIRIMSLARDRAASADARLCLEQFVDEIENRADQVRTVIRDLGGNPVFMSPAAHLQQQRAEVALHLDVPSRLQQLCDIENCWYCSLQENVHIAFLRSIIPYLDSVLAQDRLDSLLEDVAREQDDRLEWLQQALHRVLLQRAIMPSDSEWSHAA